MAKILNGEKTIEVRKKFPKEYKGWVYIYCTKDKEKMFVYPKILISPNHYEANGKVVARFYCDKVEEITNYINLSNANGICFKTNSIDNDELCSKSLLMTDELDKYLYSNNRKGYAIHISQLEIFDKPRELWQLSGIRPNGLTYILEKAPQNYCYVEVE